MFYNQEMGTRASAAKSVGLDATSAERETPESPITLTDQQMQDIARALSEPRRFQILQQIASNPCSACSDLRASIPITAPTLSHHLKELEQAGLILTSKRGKFVDLQFRRDIWNAYLDHLAQL